MDTSSSYFTEDHHRCDESWANFEELVTAGDEAGAKREWNKFLSQMRRHFTMEEEVLFPAFEDATGMRGAGPTEVMRHEHRQIRGLLDQMAAAAEAGKLQNVLDHGDTLLMLIGQHNAKEESILYRMTDQVLSGQWPELEAKLRDY